MMLQGRPAVLGGLSAQPTRTECRNMCNRKYHACTGLCDGPSDIFCFGDCSNKYLSCAGACSSLSGLGDEAIKEPDIWCWLPDFMLTAEELYFCRNLKGKVPLIPTSPPAAPAPYPFVGPWQTPADVIAAQRETTLRRQQEEAARQAEEYQRDIDLRSFSDLNPSGGSTPWTLYAVLAGVAVLGVVAVAK